MAVVFNEFDDLAAETLGFSTWPNGVNSIKQKRFYLRQKIEFYRVNNRIPKCLHQFIPNKQLQQLQRLEQLQRLKQLQQLEQLQRLQQLERLERLTMTSKDYRDVEILPNAIVYCDIPYAGTDDYGNEFSHKDFFDWAASREFPVYISEYDIPDKRFKKVYDIEKRSMMSKDKQNCKTMTEKLYWNGVSNNGK